MKGNEKYEENNDFAERKILNTRYKVSIFSQTFVYKGTDRISQTSTNQPETPINTCL